ncbi:hypothetical protein X566_23395 [Afipia sp. P52-10]|jgi:hypothetical protein|nr:hypothetical protein X566_23395 [Afipia sp. P52-10]
MGQEDRARSRQRHAAPRPREQLGVQTLFEQADLPAERGLRDVERCLGAAEAAKLGYSDEVSDLIEVQARLLR